MALSLNRADWQYSGAVSIQKPELCLPQLNSLVFSSQIVEVKSSSRGTKKRPVRPQWRWAAKLTPQTPEGQRFSQVWAPINGKRICFFRTAGTPFQIEVEALRWLPNLRMEFWQYTGPLPQFPGDGLPDPGYEFEDFSDFVEGSQEYDGVTDAGYQ